MSTTVTQVTYGDEGHAPLTSARPTHTYTHVHRWAQQCAQLDTNTLARPHEPVLSQQSLAHSPYLCVIATFAGDNLNDTLSYDFLWQVCWFHQQSTWDLDRQKPVLGMVWFLGSRWIASKVGCLETVSSRLMNSWIKVLSQFCWRLI